MFLSNATCLFFCSVSLAQWRLLSAKVSEKFHAQKINQEVTVLKVGKHKYLEARSEHIDSILQKQNIVCDAGKKIKLCNPD